MPIEETYTPPAAPIAPEEKLPTGEAARTLIDEAYKEWSASDENERERREKFKRCTRMLTMDQWEAKDRSARESAGRPIITDDRLTPAVQAIVNSERENRPSAKIHPINEESDEDTAQVIEGGIRHIEYVSQASIAYDTAFENAVGKGWGYWRLTTDYCDDGSFDNQEIKIGAIPNTLSVYPDAAACKSDLSDMMRCTILHRMPKSKYIAIYGGRDDEPVKSFQPPQGDSQSQWVQEDEVTLAEYWRVKLIPKTKYLVEQANAQIGPDGKPSAQIVHSVFDSKEEYAKGAKPGDVVLKTRPWNDRKCEQYFLTGDEVKSYRIFASKWIPIIRVTGKENYDEQGKLRFESAIEHAIDSQQVNNFYATFEAESVAIASRPKWLGALGSFKSKQSDFNNSNRSNITSLEYDAVEISPGVVAPPPQWVTFNPNVEFCLAGRSMAVQSIQATTMVFDPELGHNSSPNQSGKAINALQKKSQQGNFHFFDNLTRAQWHSYLIIIDLIPKIYDTPREIGWLGPDQARSVIKVNQPYMDPKTGKEKTHLLTAGKYGVIVTPGPSYDSQRLEAESFIETAMGTPVFAEKVPDLLVKLKDLGPIGDEIAKRVAPAGYGETDQDDPVKMKQALAQLTQQSQQMTQVIHQLMQEKEAKIVEKQAEFEKAKMQEEHADYRTITVAEINQKTTLGLAQGKLAQDALAQQLGFAHDAGMAAVEHHNAIVQAQQSHDQAQEIAQQQAEQQPEEAPASQ